MNSVQFYTVFKLYWILRAPQIRFMLFIYNMKTVSLICPFVYMHACMSCFYVVHLCHYVSTASRACV